MKRNIKDFTLEEKLRLLTGKDTWCVYGANGKVKEIHLSDGPSGLRMVKDGETVKATAMPTLSTVANSWDRELAYLDGKVIADECVLNETDVLLAPGVNIKRNPLCGRNFEYFSEDPFLAGELGKAFIEGVQDKGIGTSLKHYAANNIEDERYHGNSDVDERTLREIYLPAFEKACEAKPWTVMSSYNMINGVYASENKKMQNDILREQFGFDGLIMSDWGAVHNRYKALKATCDLQMAYTDNAYDNLKDAYDKGLITMEEIDASVMRVLNLVDKCESSEKKVEYTKEQRHEYAVKVAEEGIVLLKNEGVLPLKGKIAVGGVAPIIGGKGSSFVQTEFEQKPLVEQLQSEMPDADIIKFADGNDTLGLWGSFYRDTYRAAYAADTVVMTVGNGDSSEGEGYDRRTMKLNPRIEERIIKTAEINPNLVVVIYAGSAIDMSAWIDKVKGVVIAGYSGEGVIEALARLLSGKAVFSGKIAETYPLCVEDASCRSYDNVAGTYWYNDGIFVGYRHYDRYKKDVLFPFGHGLSYANFEYSDLKVEKKGETDYEVSYLIANNSDFDAKEISQVYVKDVFSIVSRPEKELKGFSKDLIKAHESKRVTIKLNFRSFAYYNTAIDDWYVENGDFEILVGASSRDIRLKEKITIKLPDDDQFSVL